MRRRHFPRAIKGNVQEAVGLEYIDDMIGVAQKRLKFVSLLQGSTGMLSFAAASVDACTINKASHHFPTEAKIMF